MKTEVFIRVDGGSDIGLGHLVRCLALAYMLEGEFEIHFFCKQIPASFKIEIESASFLITQIAHEDELINLLSGNEIVVIDHYGIDVNYHKKVRAKGTKVVCIDDLHDKEFHADLIINHAPGITANDYRAQFYTKFALGPNYALLRPAFLEQARKAREIRTIETVFICFGGADVKNLTLTALKISCHLNFFKRVIIVTGAANLNLQPLTEFISAQDNVQSFHDIKEEQMLNLMLSAEIAIVPASGILLEALSTKCKVVSGMYTDNQQYMFNAYKNAGCFFSAESFSENDLRSAILDAIKSIQVAPVIIDGKSPLRLKEKMTLWN